MAQTSLYLPLRLHSASTTLAVLLEIDLLAFMVRAVFSAILLSKQE